MLCSIRLPCFRMAVVFAGDDGDGDGDDDDDDDDSTIVATVVV